MAQKLIIDADPGIGDALAILAAMVDPTVDVLAVTASAGVVSGVQATRNVQYLIDLADPVRHPRIGQCNRTAGINDALPDIELLCRQLNGPHGLGDTDVRIADLHNRRESAKLIMEIAREYPGEVRLLTLGPLSNLAVAADFDPQLAEHLHSVVILGGSVSSGGDVTAAAEFNIWADAQAARAVCSLPVHRTLVPLDVSRRPVLTFDDADTLSGFLGRGPTGALVSGLLQFSLRGYHQQLALEGLQLPSVAALAVAAGAESFQTEPASVDVETTGSLTRGMTVVDRRHRGHNGNGRHNFDVVTSIDDQGVVDYFTRAIRRVCP